MEATLNEVCGYLHNWFPVKQGIHRGTFSIEDGQLSGVDFLQEGQYFRIVGSVFNDGVHRYSFAELTDETFRGEVWAMKVPPAVIALISDIEEWTEKFESVNSQNMSPFQSESFKDYSYTKKTGGSDSGGFVTWQSAFKSRLSQWRKL